MSEPTPPNPDSFNKEPTMPETAAAPEYGVMLRAERESRDLSIEDVSKLLRIRSIYIDAFEKGNTAEYPPDVYVKGFLRSYARHVKLNADEIIYLYQRHANRLAKKNEIPDKPHRTLSTSELAVVAVMILLIGGVGFWGFSIIQSSSSPTPDATTFTSVAEDPVTITTIDSPAPITPSSTDDSETAVPTEDVTEETLLAFFESTDRLLKSLPTGSVIIAATRDTWVEIRDPEGVLVLSRILGNRETYIVPRVGQFQLTSGDAGHTVIHYKPGLWHTLGAEEEVIRNVSLRPADLQTLFAN